MHERDCIIKNCPYVVDLLRGIKDGRIACSPHVSPFFYTVGRIPRILDSVAARDDLILVQEGGKTRIKLMTTYHDTMRKYPGKYPRAH